MTENQLKYLAYQENQRHNLAAEGLESDKLDEAQRSNLAKEGETARSNLVNEALRERQFLEQLVMNEDARKTSKNQRINANLRTFRDTTDQIYGIMNEERDFVADLLEAIL